MAKRSAEHQLTPEDFPDIYPAGRRRSFERKDVAADEPLKFRTKEEVLRSGKPILKLKRNLPLTSDISKSIHSLLSKDSSDQVDKQSPIGVAESTADGKNEAGENKSPAGDATTVSQVPEEGISSTEQKARKEEGLKAQECSSPLLRRQTAETGQSNFIEEHSAEMEEQARDVNQSNTMQHDKRHGATTTRGLLGPDDAGVGRLPRKAGPSEHISPPPKRQRKSGDALQSEEQVSADSEEYSSIHGTFFSRPFTNPFAEAAKVQGPFASSTDENAVSSSAMGSSIFLAAPKPSSTPLAKLEQTESEHEPAEGPTVAKPVTPRPTHFPGEENEIECFSEPNVALLKFTKVPSPEGAKDGKSASKLRPAGEGYLNLLMPTNQRHGQRGQDQRRLVLRQKGTWNVLLNTPLSLSKKFEEVAHAPSGYFVRFTGLDQRSATEMPTIAAYCLKFESDVRRQEFLSALGEEKVQRAE